MRAVFVLISCLFFAALTKTFMLLTDPFAEIRTGVPIAVLWVAVFAESVVAFSILQRGIKVERAVEWKRLSNR